MEVIPFNSYSRAGSSSLLSYTSNLCACFEKSANVHLLDFPAFLCKRPEEGFEVVSHGIEGANAIEGTVTWKALKGADSELLQ
jgi:hypothetical protein